MKTTEELLFDFTTSSLQVRMLNKEIKKLTDLRDIADSKAQEAFDIYHDRLRQTGKEIDLPDPNRDIEDNLKEKPSK